MTNNEQHSTAPLASVTILRTDRPFSSSGDGRGDVEDGRGHVSQQSGSAAPDPTDKVAPTTSKPGGGVPTPRSQCRAMAKHSHERCGQRPMPGQLVCFWHGGAAPQSRRAAEKRLATAEAAAEVASRLANTEAEPIADPLESLARLAGEVQQMRRVLADRVNRAEDPSSIGAVVDLAAYERALDRSTRLLDVLARSGFEDRRVRLVEEQAKMFAGAQRVILTRMFDTALASLYNRLGGGPEYTDLTSGLRRDWDRAVGVVVPQELRALAKRGGEA